MPHSTLLEDPLIAKKVILSEKRAGRPHVGGGVACPFCPGNEHLTPPAKLVYVAQGGVIKELEDRGGLRVKGWAVRCFDNLYPIVTPDQGGAHEVVVETPVHDEDLHRARVEQLALALRATVSRIRRMYEEGARYVALFKNHGRAAGASISHPHIQLVGLPFIPNPLLEELRIFNQECPLCHGVGHVFLEEDGFRACVPEAPLQPYEFRVYPVEHHSSILDLNDQGLTKLAKVLRSAASAMAEALGGPPYNLWLHSAPPVKGWESFHWHVEVRPSVNIHAGLELGFEVFVCSKPPSQVAEELRRALRA